MEPLKIANQLKVNWSKIPKKEYLMGFDDENEEHGKLIDDPIKIAKIALAHLNKNPNYYTIIEKALKETNEKD
jgi:hypothetical protein